MKRGLLPVVAVAVAALALSACGDDDDNDGLTIPDLEGVTVPSIPDISIPDISLPGDLTIPDFTVPDFTVPDLSIPERVEDFIRETFPDLTDEQVSCLMDESGGQAPSIDTIQQLAERCDISLSDLIPG
jgi:hypothetical protein